MKKFKLILGETDKKIESDILWSDFVQKLQRWWDKDKNKKVTSNLDEASEFKSIINNSFVQFNIVALVVIGWMNADVDHPAIVKDHMGNVFQLIHMNDETFHCTFKKL